MADTIKGTSSGVMTFAYSFDGKDLPQKITIPDVSLTSFTRANIDNFVNGVATINSGNVFVASGMNQLYQTNSTTYQGAYIEDKTVTYLDIS